MWLACMIASGSCDCLRVFHSPLWQRWGGLRGQSPEQVQWTCLEEAEGYRFDSGAAHLKLDAAGPIHSIVLTTVELSELLPGSGVPYANCCTLVG